MFRNYVYPHHSHSAESILLGSVHVQKFSLHSKQQEAKPRRPGPLTRRADTWKPSTNKRDRRICSGSDRRVYVASRVVRERERRRGQSPESAVSLLPQAPAAQVCSSGDPEPIGSGSNKEVGNIGILGSRAAQEGRYTRREVVQILGVPRFVGQYTLKD